MQNSKGNSPGSPCRPLRRRRQTDDRTPFPSSTVKDAVTSAHSQDEFFSEGVSASISNYARACRAYSRKYKDAVESLVPSCFLLLGRLATAATRNRIPAGPSDRTDSPFCALSIDTPGNLHNLTAAVDGGYASSTIRIFISVVRGPSRVHHLGSRRTDRCGRR